ncbi:hypothetical protein RRG08_031101 [Elysia crispata]|uniref:C-type lectin domain-containing protein n=1 Tax=Elysia crispata TaxID=231223 RepID=A0AAE0ZF70_9GAST|nr:hypothetical protein RRG08_031101 [Elysia crispata]
MRGLRGVLVGVICIYTGLFSPTIGIINNIKFFRNVLYGPPSFPQSLMVTSQLKIKHSATQCAATCRTSAQYNQSWSCNSFLFSRITGLCRIAHSVALLEDLFYQGHGDLYAGCDIGRGYRLYTSGSTKACLLLVRSVQTYHNALTICHQNQGYIASTKTTEKMNLIQSFLAKDVSQIWIGLSDAVKEGVYIWEEDGSELTANQLYELFDPGEPSDISPTEDCSVIRLYYSGLNDVGCNFQYAFVCEMKLMNPVQTGGLTTHNDD